MLPKEAIKEFKTLYKERFGVELSDTEAKQRAEKLVKFYALVYGDSAGPIEKDNEVFEDEN